MLQFVDPFHAVGAWLILTARSMCIFDAASSEGGVFFRRVIVDRGVPGRVPGPVLREDSAARRVLRIRYRDRYERVLEGVRVGYAMIVLLDTNPPMDLARVGRSSPVVTIRELHSSEMAPTVWRIRPSPGVAYAG